MTRTKKEFIEAFSDQLGGLLLSGFMQDLRSDDIQKVKHMKAKMGGVEPLLEKMYGFIFDEPVPEPTKELTPMMQTEALLKRYSNCPPDQQKAIVDKLRAAFNPPKTHEAKGK